MKGRLWQPKELRGCCGVVERAVIPASNSTKRAAIGVQAFPTSFSP
jgi:hypothetical protein